MGIGFSLGANVMTRYLGEEGEASRLMSACVLGCVRFTLISSLILDLKSFPVAMGSCRKQRKVSGQFIPIRSMLKPVDTGLR